MNIEAKRMVADAKNLADSTLSRLALSELIDLSVYLTKIRTKYDIDMQAWFNRGLNDAVPTPRYTKIALEDSNNIPSWWPKVQDLFTEEGGQSISPLVFESTQLYLEEQARKSSFKHSRATIGLW